MRTGHNLRLEKTRTLSRLLPHSRSLSRCVLFVETPKGHAGTDTDNAEDSSKRSEGGQRGPSIPKGSAELLGRAEGCRGCFSAQNVECLGERGREGCQPHDSRVLKSSQEGLDET